MKVEEVENTTDRLNSIDFALYMLNRCFLCLAKIPPYDEEKIGLERHGCMYFCPECWSHTAKEAKERYQAKHPHPVDIRFWMAHMRKLRSSDLTSASLLDTIRAEYNEHQEATRRRVAEAKATV